MTRHFGVKTFSGTPVKVMSKKNDSLEELLVDNIAFNKNSIKDLDPILEDIIAKNPDIAKRLAMIVKGMKDE